MTKDHKDHYDEKYTKPDLRRQIKEEIMASDKGGQPGQWSARKSQLLVHEYEKQGGDYKKSEKDEAAKSLEEWSEQDWQTEVGDDRARQGKVTKRYLPKAVWDSLSESEKREAERIKEAASRQGVQHVEWTPAIQKAMQKMEQEDAAHDDSGHEQTQHELYEKAKQLRISGRSKMNRSELLEAIEAVEPKHSN